MKLWNHWIEVILNYDKDRKFYLNKLWIIGTTELVVMAADTGNNKLIKNILFIFLIDPIEILMNIPSLCEEKVNFC